MTLTLNKNRIIQVGGTLLTIAGVLLDNGVIPHQWAVVALTAVSLYKSIIALKAHSVDTNGNPTTPASLAGNAQAAAAAAAGN